MKTSIISTASRRLRLGYFAVALVFPQLDLQSANGSYFTNTGAMNTSRYVHTATLLPNGTVLVAGGFNSDIGPVPGSESYNPSSGMWTTNGDLITARDNPTATLLTNGSVLLAGGDNFTGSVTNAELYNPSNHTWTATGSMANSRSTHTATLLQNGKVLIAGGYDYGTFSGLGSCEIYDPATAKWTTTGALNYPRYEHTATLLPNGQVLAVGGDGAGICELYDPVAGTWAVTGSTQTPRQQHTATLLPNGQVLIAGGTGDNTSELYNPATGLWTYTGEMNDVRLYHTATLLPNGTVLVAGGYNDYNGTSEYSSTELYDPSSGMWTTNLDMISARAQQTATLLPDGNVLMAGGFDGTSAVSIAELYFSPVLPSPGMWTFTGSLTNAPTGHTATLLTNGRVLVVGGSDNNGNAFASAEQYDPASGTWKGTNSMTYSRFSHTATLLQNGQVLVAGGIFAFNTSGSRPIAELFDPVRGTWALTGALHATRYGHTATLLSNGKVLVAGGYDFNNGYIASSELYDPTTGLWTTNGVLNTARYNDTATLLPSGKVLVAGGLINSPKLDTGTAELYDPSSGMWAVTGFMQNPHANHSATLLLNGLVLVAGGDENEGSFGGEGLVPVLFAELYDPATEIWTETTSTHFTHEHATATLLTNGITLIAGGGGQFGSSTNCAELYEPFTQTWTQAASMNTPRQYHTATLLPNGQVLAAGGQGNNGFLASAELYNSISRVPIILTNPIKLSSGAFQFTFTNTSGVSFHALATSNLSLSLSNWSVIGSIPEISPGLFQFTDTQATNSLRRFYGVRSP